ncbi:MAG: 16S rRNA processing protein RimM [Candidatus Aminicenantes bacterium]|nr:16S rRNA processing protein RimM [Candidatus Aminicenantes bacterium]
MFFLDSEKSLFFSGVFLDKKGTYEELIVTSIKPFKNAFLIKLEGIDSIEDACPYAGRDVHIPEEQLSPLEAGAYYHFQLIGCSVFTDKGCFWGTVEGFHDIPGNSLLIVRKQKKEILIPFVDSLVLEVNLEKKEIKIDPPAGLLEMDEI